MCADYPKRPSFFANRFVRLLGKACVANTLGPSTALMLTFIAHQEDAAGYRGPVTYWNGQLLPLIGLDSVDALERLRRKAIDAGWLHYDRGSRFTPASYWVTIPDKYAGWDDAPTCEMPGEYTGGTAKDETRDQPRPKKAVSRSRKANNSGQTVTPQVSPEQAENEGVAAEPLEGDAGSSRVDRGLIAGLSRVDRGSSAEPSSLSLSLSLSQEIKSCPAVPDVAPIAVEPTTPSESDPPPKPRKEPTGDHHAAIRCFCDTWKLVYKTDYAFAGGKDGATIAGMLKRPGVTLDGFRAAVARYFADSSAFVLDAKHGLGVFSSQFHKYTTDVKSSAGGVHDRGASRTYRAPAKPGKYDDLDRRRPGDPSPPLPPDAGGDGTTGRPPGDRPPDPGNPF